MLVPSRSKHRKMQKGRVQSNSKGGTELAFGSFGLKALQMSRITSRQLEAARIAATRYMQRKGKLWIKIFPSIPVSKRPPEVRMGKGKGSPEYFVFRVSPGRIVIEVDGVSPTDAIRALELAGGKMPFKTKVTSRKEIT
jgi:large subunit ribosomal protein L16